MSYVIRINYTTGNSFEEHEDTEVLDYNWNDIEIVRRNLIRLKNHYKFKKNHSCWSKPDIDLPEGVRWDEKYKYIQLILLLDDGKEQPVSSCWSGYFENVQNMAIELKGDDELDSIDFYY